MLVTIATNRSTHPKFQAAPHQLRSFRVSMFPILCRRPGTGEWRQSAVDIAALGPSLAGPGHGFRGVLGPLGAPCFVLRNASATDLFTVCSKNGDLLLFSARRRLVPM
jgi:hypothetical protein